MRHACDKCGGTGEVRWGKCYSCKGKGSFATSPERRAAARVRAEKSINLKRIGAQQENRNKTIYLYVMTVANHQFPLILQMSVDHKQGRQWTPGQLASAQSLRAQCREAREIFRRANASEVSASGSA